MLRSLITALILLVFAAPAFGLSVEELIALKQNGASDSELQHQLQHCTKNIDVQTDDLIAMKKAGFSSDMIKAVLLFEPTVVKKPIVDTKKQKIVKAIDMLELSVRNRDSQEYYLKFLDDNTLEISMKKLKDLIPLKNGGETILSLPAGEYRMIASEGEYSYTVKLRKGVRSELQLQTFRRDGSNEFQLTLVENGKSIVRAILHGKWSASPSVTLPMKVVVKEAPTKKVVIKEQVVEKIIIKEVPKVRYVYQQPKVYYYSSPSYYRSSSSYRPSSSYYTYPRSYYSFSYSSYPRHHYSHHNSHYSHYGHHSSHNYGHHSSHHSGHHYKGRH